MNDYITANVFRYNSEEDDKPYYIQYLVKVEEEISVLVLLNRIQSDIDQTLSFRSYCCGLQMCRSCLMKINQKKKYACLTMVKPGDEILLEPASYPDLHVKDLVIKQS